MIISCDSCNKSFEIESKMITAEGRLLECGVCKHQWFFKKKDNSKEESIILNDLAPSSNQLPENLSTNSSSEESDDNEIIINQDFNDETDAPSIEKDNSKDRDLHKKKINQKKSSLSYILVFIISVISIIVLIDTFKNPLSKIFPNIEAILYNLYETPIDIFLFIKDLF